MVINRKLYAVHRWIAAIAMVQLAIWNATGLFFAVVPLAEVRGEDRTVEAKPTAIPWDTVKAPPTEHARGAQRVTLRVVDGKPRYVVKFAKRRIALDASTGQPTEIDAETAKRIARRDQAQSPAVLAVTRVNKTTVEYRRKPLPAWRVDLDDGRGTRCYVDAISGQVTARRNDTWRIFDFFWSLHIMDYGDRSNFNHPLLVIAALFGLITVLSGMVLWGVRLRRRFQKA